MQESGGKRGRRTGREREREARWQGERSKVTAERVKLKAK